MAEVDVSDDLDLDALFRCLDGVTDDFVFDFDAVPPPAIEESSGSSWKSEIEKFLMDDVDGDEVPEVGEGFQSDFFSDVLPPDGGTSGEVEKENKKVESVVVSVDEDEDDASRKKRRRQMRNRESAIKSRERKKIYVKDLETKSKYLEIECRRLQHALQCCAAENMALRQRLQKGRALSAFGARQESAVLLESLLLGSLFWLVSIVCLIVLPVLPSLHQKEASRLGRGPALEVVTAKRIGTYDRVGCDLGSSLVLLRRRCRGTRARMKPYLLPVISVSA